MKVNHYIDAYSTSTQKSQNRSRILNEARSDRSPRRRQQEVRARELPSRLARGLDPARINIHKRRVRPRPADIPRVARVELDVLERHLRDLIQRGEVRAHARRARLELEPVVAVVPPGAPRDRDGARVAVVGEAVLDVRERDAVAHDVRAGDVWVVSAPTELEAVAVTGKVGEAPAGIVSVMRIDIKV